MAARRNGVHEWQQDRCHLSSRTLENRLECHLFETQDSGDANRYCAADCAMSMASMLQRETLVDRQVKREDLAVLGDRHNVYL